jgi:hypothetical protein
VVYGGENAPHIHSDALHRKTKVAHRDRKDKRGAYQTKALDLEILKMQMAMEPIQNITEDRVKPGDEEASKLYRIIDMVMTPIQELLLLDFCLFTFGQAEQVWIQQLPVSCALATWSSRFQSCCP